MGPGGWGWGWARGSTQPLGFPKPGPSLKRCPLSREKADPLYIRVQLGEQHLYYQDRLLLVSRIIVHPNYYDEVNGADIALLELEDPVNLSSHVQPVTLPPASETFPKGTRCWVTGWGDVHSGCGFGGQPEGDMVTSQLHPFGEQPSRRRCSFLASRPQGPCHRRIL